MSDYTLYWEALSGAFAPQAMFEEMNIPYRRIEVDMAAGEHRSAEYLAVNPTGQVPALGLPDGSVIGESGAMVLVIGERHPAAGLVPAPGDADRALFLRWLLFMASSVYMACVRVNHPERYTTADQGLEPVRAAARRDVDRYFGILEQAIEGRPWFLVRGFGALDIYLGMLTLWHPDLDALFARHEKVGELCRALSGRPACARVMNEHAG